MWNHPISFGLTLIQEAASRAFSLVLAPVPPDENKGLGSLVWTILAIIIAAAMVVLIYKVLSKSAGKSDK